MIPSRRLARLLQRRSAKRRMMRVLADSQSSFEPQPVRAQGNGTETATGRGNHESRVNEIYGLFGEIVRENSTRQLTVQSCHVLLQQRLRGRTEH